MPIVSPRPYKEMQAAFWKECERLADLASAAYFRNPMQRLYIAGRKRAGLDTLNPLAQIWQEFFLVNEYDERDGWEIVCGEHIPRNYPVTEYPSWIHERLKREPNYIFAD